MSYRSREQILQDFKSLCTTHSAAYETVGKTVENRDIILFKIGNPNGGRLLIDASIHGNEYATSEILYYYLDWLLTSNEPAALDILNQNYTLLLPLLNVDRYRQTRKNANGVDLNRNFPVGWCQFTGYGGSTDPNHDNYKGPSGLSEPEARTLHNVFNTYHPEWYVNMHTGDNRLTPPWAYTSTPPPDRNYHQQVYNKIVALSNQRGVSSYPWITSSGLGGCARDEGYDRGAHSFTLEVDARWPPPYNEIVSVLTPRFIVIAVVLSQEIAIQPPPQPTPSLGLLALTALSLFILTG